MAIIRSGAGQGPAYADRPGLRYVQLWWACSKAIVEDENPDLLETPHEAPVSTGRLHVVLIFGWGQGSVDDRGEVAPVRCPNCHNDVFLHLVRSTKEVSLYFVPVMPYGTDEYLVCRVCGHGLHVALEHQSAVEGMRAATLLFREGRITEPDYRARTDRFWQSMGVSLEAGAIPRPAPPARRPAP